MGPSVCSLMPLTPALRELILARRAGNIGGLSSTPRARGGYTRVVAFYAWKAARELWGRSKMAQSMGQCGILED